MNMALAECSASSSKRWQIGGPRRDPRFFTPVASGAKIYRLSGLDREQVAAQDSLRDVVSSRINALRTLAADEGVAFDETSAVNLMAFLSKINVSTTPKIYLLDSGRLRAVWSDASGQQIAAQFGSDELIQFVIFASRDGGRLARFSGIETIDGFKAQIIANRMTSLLQ